MEDYEQSGHPKEATTDKKFEHLHRLSVCDRRSLHDIARQTGIKFGAVQSILTHIIGMSKVSARWVPRILTKNQKKSRLDISMYLCISSVSL